MSDQFLTEIRIFPFSFPPKGWAFCDGQIMPISQNTAVFALVGTYYGGDGKSTFALPNLRDSAAMHSGTGQGLTERRIGETGGTDSVTLLVSEIPVHTHSVQVSTELADIQIPNSFATFARSSGGSAYTASSSNLTTMAPQALSPAGGGLPHNNLQPYLTLNFCIALQGVFPQRP